MIEFKNVSKSFKNVEVLKEIDITIPSGNLVVIVGESGCGKTTLLKLINKLVTASHGEVLINNKNIKNYDITKLRRKMGYIIQQTGIFPHMTIKENIEIIPKLEKLPSHILFEKTKEIMKLVGLDPHVYMDRYPNELSGGQQQRVGVARAFITDPEIILMDEPFSALDPITRSDLQDELVRLQSKLKKTIVFVTHDMDEAIKIADMICVMKDGYILQYDHPENILKNPVDDYVANFIGKNRIWSSPEYIKVKDIMIERPFVTSPEASIFNCIEKMRINKIDSLPVIDITSRKILGILKPKHIRRATDRSIAASNLMQVNFLRLHPEDNIIKALKLTTESKSPSIPVVDDNEVLQGLITKSSLVTALSQQYIDMEVD